MPETSRTIALADRIDRLNAAIGRTVAWACLLVVLVQFAVVVMRYVFGAGSIWLTETIIYGHATLFMLAAAWTLREGGHVRVDIFYADAGPHRRALIDLCGALLLLLPFMLVLLWFAVPLCRALLVDHGDLARNQRPAGRVPAQDAHSGVRRADGVARHLAGDSCRARADGSMMHPELLAILMVVAVCGLLFFGYPVALTLGGVSLAFAALGHLTGAMGFSFIGALPQRVYGVMTNEVLLAIPLFIFMGVMLERSRIAEDLLETMGRLFGTLRGGLGISVAIVGTLLAAAKGVVGATTVTMGLIVLPTMLRHGYDKRLAAGTVAATATLGADLPARHRARAARRPALDRLSGRPAPAGQFRAVVGDGERSVRRRARAGASRWSRCTFSI